MYGIPIGDETRRSEYEQEEVGDQEVRCPERQFNNLDNEFSGWLRHDMVAQPATIPLSGPPCSVRLIMLELTREEYRYENLV